MRENGAGRNLGAVALAGIVGNVMEWYDFAVYGYFAAVIGTLYFPSRDPAVSLLASFGAFAIGFLARPVGGLAIGRIGDLVGRKRALTLSILAMAFPTVLLGLLPTYETIGIAAPIAVVALRLLQGLAVGGEYTSSLVFLAEHASSHRRGFLASWGMWGCVAGILLGSAVGALVTNVFDASVVADWAWRLPFVVGGLVAGCGIIIRRRLRGAEVVGTSRQPIRDAFGMYRGIVFRVTLMNVALAVGFYAAFVYAVTYLKNIDHLAADLVFDLNTTSMAILLVFLPASALLSDQIGRKPLVVAGTGLLTFGAVPLFALMHSQDVWQVFCGEMGFAIALAVTGGGLVPAEIELLPRSVRCTGLAFALNTAFACFGGTTPLVATWLILRTGNPIAPGYYIAALGALSFVTAIFFLPETRFKPFV